MTEGRSPEAWGQRKSGWDSLSTLPSVWMTGCPCRAVPVETARPFPAAYAWHRSALSADTAGHPPITSSQTGAAAELPMPVPSPAGLTVSQSVSEGREAHSLSQRSYRMGTGGRLIPGPRFQGLNPLPWISAGPAESVFTSQAYLLSPVHTLNVSQQQPRDSGKKYLDKKPLTKTQMPFNRGCAPGRVSQLPEDWVRSQPDCLRAVSGDRYVINQWID